MSEQINHEVLGASRFALQYQQATKLRAFAQVLLVMCNNIEDCLQTLALLKDIDNAYGAHLDVIGDIVGISRIVPNSLPLKFFGFADTIGGSGNFGEETDIGVGSRFWDEGEPLADTTILNDPEYKLLIRAKIVKNHSKGNGDSILQGLQYLFGPAPVNVTNFGGMHMGVSIGRLLSFQERAIITQLDILPCPAGVGITSRVTYAGPVFGFADTPGGLPFGEETDPSIGGIFAEEF